MIYDVSTRRFIVVYDVSTKSIFPKYDTNLYSYVHSLHFCIENQIHHKLNGPYFIFCLDNLNVLSLRRSNIAWSPCLMDAELFTLVRLFCLYIFNNNILSVRGLLFFKFNMTTLSYIVRQSFDFNVPTG